ncbi:MAG: phage tail tape measure protein, partial [Candidatus Adiutrix sp.]|nr:phage tail tape measure protein [Candidatus Adiutrix sp.]
MATIIDSLLITLGLDPSGVEKGVKQADNAISGGVKRMESNLATAAKSAAKFLAPVLGAAAIKSAINNYVATADALGDLSESLNMSGNELDAWGKAAQVAGGSAEGLSGTLQSMGTQIQNAVTFGMKRSQKVFDELGISLKNVDGTTKSATQVLEDLAGAAETMDKAQFGGIAKKLGIDQGTIMLLQRGRAGVQELVEEMRGLSMTDEEIARAGDYDEQMNRLSFSVKAVANMFLQFLVPALDFVAQNLTKIFSFLRENKAFTYAFFGGLAAIIAAVVVPALVSMAAAAVAAMAPFLPFIALIAAVALAIDDLWTYIQGGDAVLTGLWAQFGTGEEIAAKLTAAWGTLQEAGVKAWEMIQAAAQKAFDYFGPAAESYLDLVKSVFSLLAAAVEGDTAAMGESIKNVFVNLGEYIFNVISGALHAVWDLAVSIFSSLVDFIYGKF